MSWFKYNVEASTQFHTIHLFPIPVPASVNTPLLPPANDVCEGYVFTRVCQSFCSQGGMRGCRGGVRGCGGHVWLQGGVRGCQGACVVGREVCVVAGGHAWLLGGMCGCRGACMVAGGHAWLPGGMRGCRGTCVGYDKIQSMSGRYTSYWNAFLFRQFYLKITRKKDKLNCNEQSKSHIRVATAQGKQGIWFLLFPDRENTGNFALTQGKIPRHRENIFL